MNPTVLIVTSARWFQSARLAVALAEAGCTVEAVCPAGHPIGKTNAAYRLHVYRALAPVKSIAGAIADAQPDIVVPCDDLSVRHLHELHRREKLRGENGASTCALIERSLGSPESFPVVYSRTAFMKLAQQEGVRGPQTEVIENLDDLKKWIARSGLPMVLKANGTSGGDGVRIVRTHAEAERAFHELQAPPLVARAAKRALLDHDHRLVAPSLLRRRSIVNAQAFVSGHEATSVVACWNGTVLAGLHCEVVNKSDSTGPATVMRLIENPDMTSTAEKMVRRLNLSGMYGFDFMLETATGHAHLIEINPRTTQIAHLALGAGRDLPAALFAALSGKTVKVAPAVTEKDTIALFPQEWSRDAASPFLKSAYHDIPWEQPELVLACVNQRRKRVAWYSRSAPMKTPPPVRARKLLSAQPLSTSSAGGTVGLDWEAGKSRYE